MPVDPSIYSQVKPVQFPNPVEQYATLAQLGALKDQSAIRQLERQKLERGMAREGELAEIYRQSGGDEGRLSSLLRGRGFFPEAAALEKERLSGLKTQADIGKDTADTRLKSMEYLRDVTANVRSDQDMAFLKGEWGRLFGEQAAARIPERYDPAWQQDNLRRAQDAFAQLQNQLNRAVTMRGQDLTAGTAMRGQDITQRGQDISAETAREGHGVTMRGQDLSAATALAGRDEAARNRVQSNVASLRKEIESREEHKVYQSVLPALQSAREALKRDTSAADMNLVYATAKIFDPTSVVREGEYATVNMSQPPGERVQGLINFLAGGGRITPRHRQSLMAEIESRANAAEDQYAKMRQSYEGIAERAGAPLEDVFPDVGSFKHVIVGGKKTTARQAPDGKFYVERGGKFYRVE